MNLSGVMLLLVEAYSAHTGQYMVIGGFRTTAALQLALSTMDEKNRRTVRVSILSTEDIRGPHGRVYFTAEEVREW
jgi:hypothetical protein